MYSKMWKGYTSVKIAWNFLTSGMDTGTCRVADDSQMRLYFEQGLTMIPQPGLGGIVK